MSHKNISHRQKGNYPTNFRTSEAVQNEINRIVDTHLKNWMIPYDENEDEIDVFEPNIEIMDSPTAVQVSAELPGMDAKDIEINVSDDGYLTISGEKKHQTEEKSKGYYFSERSYGMIQRTVPLPPDIDSDKTTAEFEKGVLTIHIPKLESAKKKIKKINVKSK